jgi:hypothetical protein
MTTECGVFVQDGDGVVQWLALRKDMQPQGGPTILTHESQAAGRKANKNFPLMGHHTILFLEVQES